MKRQVRWRGEIVGTLFEQGAEMFEVYGRFVANSTPASSDFLAAIEQSQSVGDIELVGEKGRVGRYYFGTFDGEELTLKHDLSTPRSRRWRYIGRRLAAALTDMLIIAGWIVFTTLVALGLPAIGWTPTTPTGWDVYAFCTLVAPTIATFACLEATGGTLGKRRFDLVVVNREELPLGLTHSLVRSTIKFAPWQLAHTAVFQLSAGREDALWWVLSITAQVWVLVSCLAIVLTRRGLHDFAAGSQCIDK